MTVPHPTAARRAAPLLLILLLAAACGDGGGDASETSAAPPEGAPLYTHVERAVDPARAMPRLFLSGVRLSVAPPGGFEPAADFLGFHRADLSASILLDENAVPLAETLAGLTDEALEAAGLVVLGREEVPLGDHVALRVHLRQDLLEGRAPIEKLLIVLGDAGHTATATLVYPVAQREELARPMADASLSVRWHPERPFDPLAGLGFTIAPPPVLAFSHRIQNQAHFAAGGYVADDPTRPRLVAGRTVVRRGSAELQADAEALLDATNGVEGIELETSEGVAVDTRDGWACVATARDAVTGEPLVLYQLALVDGDDAYLVKGRGPLAERDRWLDAFEDAAHTVRTAR